MAGVALSIMLDHVALGDVANSSTVLKASIAGVNGSAAAYMRSNANVSNISRMTSILKAN